MKNIKELEKKYEETKNIMEELGKEIEKLKNEKKVWKPETDEIYYFIYTSGTVGDDVWDEESSDAQYYSIGNCYKTQEEAEKEIERRKIFTQLKRYAEEHNQGEIDWSNDNQVRYYIYYDCKDKIIKVNASWYYKNINNVYFTSNEIAKQALKEIGKDRIKLLFEV